jgi:serine-type D-Ala-D-Ala carboxypeptidase/endopeptidase
MGGVVRRAFGLGALFAAIARTGWAQGLPRTWNIPDDAEIRRILKERIEVQKQGVGIVVGVIDASGRRVVAEGVRAKGDTRALDGATVFEIGSMTKVFTGLLLADMVAKDEVRLDQPVAELLPDGVSVPVRSGRQITLVDLATHTSALPGLPTNFSPKDMRNPYVDYTADQLYAFLGGHALAYDIGGKYAYSNLGAGLLGHALARRAGGDYETVVRRRILGPMGLRDTAIALTPNLRGRLAPGHDGGLQPAANWDLTTLAGAGALRSTADDMLTFLGAATGLSPSPLKPALDAMLAVRRPADGPIMQIALGWHVATAGGREVVWHNGGTGGYRSFFGYDPAAKVGVVVLTNVANPVGGDDIGFHLLTGRPLAKLAPPIVRTAATLTPADVQGLAGRYVFGSGPVALTVTVEGAKVSAQLTGQPAFEIHPESRDRFFWKVVDAQATFERGPGGRATAVTLHQAGTNQKARRAEP